MAKGCTWLFGRGASIANGLEWVVPASWYEILAQNRISRQVLMDRIIVAIREEMDNPKVHLKPYEFFINYLAMNTKSDCYHNLLTTNWDYLLQRALNSWISKNHPGVSPQYLGTHSSILHLNGSVEPRYTYNRSPFLLETDNADFRKQTVESNVAFHKIIWSNYVVFVGMSFECNIDKGLLAALCYHEDNIPFGEAVFIIVEPNHSNLVKNVENMKRCFPRATIVSANKGFEEWLEIGMPELKELFL